MTPNQQSDVLRKWQETASFWSRYHDEIREMFMPLTYALVEDARIERGQSVLDVAGGSGEPSLTIAKLVGPDGSVMCTDAVGGMVEAARSEGEKLGVSNVQFQRCSAENLPFADDSFDATVSRLGAMFFPNALAASGEMIRVVKPGGALAVAVWHHNEVNPFMAIPTEVVARHIDSPPPDPEALDAFRFAEPGKLARILNEAGATNVSERVFKFDLEAPLSADEYWQFRSEVSETLRGKLAKLSDEERAQIAAEVREAVAPFFANDVMRIPAQFVIVSGEKRA